MKRSVMNKIQVGGMLLYMLLSVRVNAQTDFDYAKALANVDVFLEHFRDYSDFREPLKDEVSGTARDQFKSLFKPGVYILDLYNPPRMDQNGQYMPILPFTQKSQPKIRTIDEFAEDVTRFCNRGISVKITGINADYSQLRAGKVKMYIQREGYVRDFQDWRYTVLEELELELEWNEATSSYWIASMEVQDNYVVKCSNCEDRFAARVDPADDPKQPLKLWASIQGNAGMAQVSTTQVQADQLNTLIYNDIVLNETKLGAMTSSGLKPSWGIEGSAQLMKGYKHQWGISLGLAILNTSAEFVQDPSTIVYQSTDAFGNSYNRQVKLEGTTINANLLTLQAPLQFHYTRRVSKKLKLHGALGAYVAFAGTLKTEQSALADYEALLKFEAVSESEVISVFEANGEYDVELTETTLTGEQRNNSAALGVYDIDFDRGLSGKSKVKTSLGYGVMARLGAGWMINSNTEALVSVGTMIGVQNWDAEKLTLADRTNDVQSLGSSLTAAGEWKSFHILVNGGVRFYLSSFNKNPLNR
jgi:hypothetical protein